MKPQSQCHRQNWNLFKKPSRQFSWILFAVFLLLALLDVIESQFLVKTLPGLDGDLPFKLETGYIGVGEMDDVQLFYYFIESEGNPKDDPLMVWLTGGPGCSALSGLLYEIGPFIVDNVNSTLEKPKLEINPHSWTKAASIIFVDQPSGSGFSYARSPQAYITNDTLSTTHAYNFLNKWLMDHPKFLNNALYLGGDSYMVIVLPMIVQEIYNGNKVKQEKKINLKGYVLGNPLTDTSADYNARIPFAYRMALLSDAMYKTANANCHGEYVNVAPSNCLCIHELQVVDKNDNYMYSAVWANSRDVQEALHIREEFSDIEWVRCNETLRFHRGKEPISYTHNVLSTVDYHRRFVDKSCRALIYSGDHDMIVPYMGTLKWVQSLNLPILDDWRPWFVDEQVAGYMIKYSTDGYDLTFATVKGGGHTAPEYKPKECLNMLMR